MFKKSHRLHTSEFKEVFNFGKTVRNPYFVVKTKPNELAHSRFAVVVSKKISKKAVRRNHLKRRFAHALKEKQARFAKGDYVFVLSAGVADLSYEELLRNFDTI